MAIKSNYYRYSKKRGTLKRFMKKKYGIKRVINRYKRSKLTSLIKKVIRKDEEVKSQYMGVSLNPFCISSSTTSLSGNFLCLTPNQNITTGCYNISQGVNSNQRIGNKINVKSVEFRYCINPQPYNSLTNPTPMPVEVKLFFFKQKLNSTSLLSASSFNGTGGTFLDIGSSLTGFTGSLFDLTTKVNSEDFTLIATRRHKIGFNYFTGTGQVQAWGQASNNDFKLNVLGKIVFSKGMSQVQWDDNGNISTPPIWMVVQVLDSDNNANNSNNPPGVTINRIRLTTSTVLNYTDA